MTEILQLKPEDFGIIEENFDDIDNLRRETKEDIRKSNLHILKANQHKIKVCKHIFEVEYYDISTSYKRNRRKLPIQDYNNLDLNFLADNKRFQWLYSVEGIQFGKVNGKVRPKMFKMQEFPFAVLDIDGVTYNDMYKLIFIDKKWKFANKNNISMCPSTTGRGVHIHVCIDLSNENRTQYPFLNESSMRSYYTTTYEYRMFKYIQTWLADSFYKDTGIRPDYNAIALDRIAVTPREIGEINKQWKDKAAVKFSDPEIFRGFDDYSPARTSKYRGRVEAIVNQIKSFTLDKNHLSEWMTYLQEIGITPGKQKYYEEVITTIKNNFKTIENHFLKHMEDLSWFRKKRSDIAIPQKDVARMILGINTKRNETYFRHFILYMFGLRVEKNYEFRKLTNTYTVSEVERKYFNDDFLERYWYLHELRRVRGEFKIPPIQEIASRLGNGRTHEELCRFTKFLTSVMGADKAIAWLSDAIDISDANNKPARKSFVTRFCLRIERQRSPENVQDERWASSY